MTREELILTHRPLAIRIAASFAKRVSPFVETDDLIGAGYIGLTIAANRYNPDSGIPFAAFARKRIVGEIIVEIRRQNNLFGHRNAWQMQRNEETFRKDFVIRHKREPEDGEVAEGLGFSLSRYNKLRQDLQPTLSLETEYVSRMHDKPETLKDIIPDVAIDPATYTLSREYQGILDNILSDFSDKEREAMVLSCVSQWFLFEIADLWGVSESRVCQIRKPALEHTKRRLFEELELKE